MPLRTSAGGDVSASLYQSQLDRKRKQRIEAEKKSGDYRSRESSKRAAAAKAMDASRRTKNESTAKSKLRDSERREKEAQAAGQDANKWQTKASSYAKEEASLMSKLASAQRAEGRKDEQRRIQQQRRTDRQVVSERTALEQRVDLTEMAIDNMVRELREPRAERLRVLILGASSEGDLRVGREQSRIRTAVQAALHRDQIELDVRPAATTSDLLDGITRFRPHVVHFSGHSNEELIVFEDDNDELHRGFVVTAEGFKRAIQATDDPPLLVLLNSCRSAAQLPGLVDETIPFAIGMSESIEDLDAINYAAQFYSAIANGQSIQSAHLSGQVALELAGLNGADLPTLASGDGMDASQAILVTPG